jgi:hypothetical protein
VEFKAPGKEPTPLQWLEIADMRAHGATVFVIDNIEEFKRHLHSQERT